MKTVDQATGGGNVPDRLGNIRTGKWYAALQGTTRDPGLAQQPRKADLVENLHQTTVVLSQGADFFLKPWEQGPLKALPVI